MLIDGAKVAGILLEAASDAHGSCSWLIIGMGVNVAARAGGEVPYATHQPGGGGAAWAHTRASSSRPSRRRCARALTNGRRRASAGRSRSLARACGQAPVPVVEVRLGERVVGGRMLDVDETGALRLEDAAGKVERFAAGEVDVSPLVPDLRSHDATR